MSFDLLPEPARISALIQVLDSKLAEPGQGNFDYRGELVRLAKQVTGEVTYINQLFPEYTPHDSNYHLNRLFHVADIVVEKRRFDALNSAELFVLAAALYSHDWGMAVSEAERLTILELLDGKEPPSRFSLLSDEKDRLSTFARSRGLDGKAVVQELPHWRDYVRKTHPERSAARVRAFFAKAGGGVGDAVARVARGHGVDIAELDKPNEYPTDFSVMGLNANLRALAVYVRLIDLLDIADDRTPYAIWEFVSPRDMKSAIEWKNHRALNPVTCPAYQSGRMILVDGSTNDPDVWAALRDLERYVREQVRGCNDVLARLSDNNFHLDLTIVEWRVATPGFTPIDLRFEFHRESMFQILGEEIYDGDVYVFLRELLQNSIDAIRLRTELLAKQDVTTAGIIHFQVEHRDNGSATVCCYDNGIGMDEHIIRNYLALAGRSYYSSDEFKYLGLQMDAIARFGIGILSCFMAAESIEIETLRDPMIANTRTPLRIVIPSVEHQFRVYPGGSHLKTGTCVTVYVAGERLKSAPENWNVHLRVTDYLSEVGAFSEIPILVSEGGVETLILRPGADETNAKEIAMGLLGNRGAGVTLAIRIVAQHFPWEGIFAPQDEEKAASTFRVEWFDLEKELGLNTLEGRTACLIPNDETVFAQAFRFSEDDGDYMTTLFGRDLHHPREGIRWFEKWTRRRERVSKPRSIAADAAEHAYCNGMLVIGSQRNEFHTESVLPDPAMWVNIPRGHAVQLNVARQEARNQMPVWKEQVANALQTKVLDDQITRLLAMQAKDRLRRIGQLMCWYRIPANRLIAALPPGKRPIAWMSPDLSWEFVDDETMVAKQWPTLPSAMNPAATRSFATALYGGLVHDDTQVTRNWDGERAIFYQQWQSGDSYTNSALQFINAACDEARPIKRMRFLRGPRDSADMIAQVTLELSSSEASNVPTEKVREKAISEPHFLKIEDWCRLADEAEDKTYLSWTVSRALAWFLPPNEDVFACGRIAWNIAHPVVQTFLRWSLLLESAKQTKSMEKREIGKLGDALHAMSDATFYTAIYSPASWEILFRNTHSLLARAGLNLPGNLPPAPRKVDFVIGSWIGDENTGHLLVPSQDENAEAASVRFGSLIC